MITSNDTVELLLPKAKLCFLLNRRKELPYLAQHILKDAIENPENYPYLFGVTDSDQTARREPRKLPVIDQNRIDYYENFSYLDIAMEKKLIYQQEYIDLPDTIVYILGVDHEHKSSSYNIRALFDFAKPDILAVEDFLDKQKDPDGWENHQKMMKIVKEYDCDVEAITKKEPRENLIDAFLFPNIDDDDDNQQVNPYGDFLLSLGHLNNIDSIVPYYLCMKRKVKIECIDIHDDVFEHLEKEDASIFKVEAIKYWYGLDCDPPVLDVDNVQDLIEATIETPMCGWLELNRQLEIQYNPEGHLFETHARDIHMIGRLQEVCQNNPGKTIICLVGADHMLGMHDLFYSKIPKNLTKSIANCKSLKRRKKLFKKLAKLGATKNGRLVNPEKLPIIGTYSDESTDSYTYSPKGSADSLRQSYSGMSLDNLDYENEPHDDNFEDDDDNFEDNEDVLMKDVEDTPIKNVIDVPMNI